MRQQHFKMISSLVVVVQSAAMFKLIRMGTMSARLTLSLVCAAAIASCECGSAGFGLELITDPAPEVRFVTRVRPGRRLRRPHFVFYALVIEAHCFELAADAR
jgi:hypothetical protein